MGVQRSFSEKKLFKGIFLRFISLKIYKERLKKFAGHIKVPGGPHVTRGPDVSLQACHITREVCSVVFFPLVPTLNDCYR